MNDVSSSSESPFSSTTTYPLTSTTTEADSSVDETTVVPSEESAETVTPLTKITTIGSQIVAQTIETNAKGGEPVASTTINAETTPSSRTEEISHREHGRALNLTALPAKAKGLNDLSDVSMDDDTYGDGNGAKEEMVIAQTQHKECESKVRKSNFRKLFSNPAWHTTMCTSTQLEILNSCCSMSYIPISNNTMI